MIEHILVEDATKRMLEMERFKLETEHEPGSRDERLVGSPLFGADDKENRHLFQHQEHQPFASDAWTEDGEPSSEQDDFRRMDRRHLTNADTCIKV